MSASIPVTEFPHGVPFISGSFAVLTRPEAHEKFMSLFSDWALTYIKEGHAVYRFNDGMEVDVPEDHFILLPPYVPSWRETVQSPLTIWYCHFAFHPVPKNIFLSLHKDYFLYEERILIPMVFPKKTVPKVWMAFRDFLALGPPSGRPPWTMERALLLLMSELGEFALKARDNDTLVSAPEITSGIDSRPADPRLVKLIRKIGGDPAYPWKVSKLASSVGLSLSHLERLSHACFGKSLKQYIVETRLKHALEMLNTPEGKAPLSMKQISAACGFSSQQQFSQQFKKFFSVMPSKRRQQGMY